MKEKEIIEKCKSGEIGAYKFLYDRYNRPLFHTAYRMLGNREDAEDAVQTTFIKLYKGIKRFKFKAKFSTYLFQILINTCIDMNKKKSKIRLGELGENSAVSMNTDVEIKMEIDRALHTLPPKQKQCFLLFTVGDRKQREIAKILGISLGGVKSNIFLAKSKLRSYLNESIMRG